MKKQPKYTPENKFFANLEKFQSIDLDGDWDRVKNRIGFRKQKRVNTIWRAAAILITVISVGFLSRQLLFAPVDMVIASAGPEIMEIHLPDGSLVHLNSYSELEYPEKFKISRRSVRLTGEGFFEVAHDPGKPFQVNVADRARVEVLGTSFNIESSNSGDLVKVQVLEGRVAFSGVGDGQAAEVLGKDEMASLQNGKITKSDLVNKNFLSWKTGIMTFDQETLTDVVQTLQDFYGRELILDVSVDTNLTFTSTIDNQALENVLDEMKLVLGISFSVEDTIVKIYMTD